MSHHLDPTYVPHSDTDLSEESGGGTEMNNIPVVATAAAAHSSNGGDTNNNNYNNKNKKKKSSITSTEEPYSPSSEIVDTSSSNASPPMKAVNTANPQQHQQKQKILQKENSPLIKLAKIESSLSTTEKDDDDGEVVGGRQQTIFSSPSSPVSLPPQRNYTGLDIVGENRNTKNNNNKNINEEVKIMNSSTSVQFGSDTEGNASPNNERNSTTPNTPNEPHHTPTKNPETAFQDTILQHLADSQARKREKEEENNNNENNNGDEKNKNEQNSFASSIVENKNTTAATTTTNLATPSSHNAIPYVTSGPDLISSSSLLSTAAAAAAVAATRIATEQQQQQQQQKEEKQKEEQQKQNQEPTFTFSSATSKPVVKKHATVVDVPEIVPGEEVNNNNNNKPFSTTYTFPPAKLHQSVPPKIQTQFPSSAATSLPKEKQSPSGEEELKDKNKEKEKEKEGEGEKNNNIEEEQEKENKSPPPHPFKSTSNPNTYIPWNQRVPQDRSLQQAFAETCDFCLAPKFWKRIETSLRSTLLAWLPVIMIVQHPEWKKEFSAPFVLSLLPIFVAGAKFGKFFAGIVALSKALAISMGFATILTWYDFHPEITTYANVTNITTNMTSLVATTITHTPASSWLFFWLVYFFSIVIMVIFTDGSITSKFCPYFYSGFCMLKWFKPDHFGSPSDYYPNYLRDAGIGLGLALLPCFFPYPIFALKRAEQLLYPMGNTISILVQGIVASAWTPNAVEQRLDLIRLRQVEASLRSAESHINAQLGMTFYEPFGAVVLKKFHVRFQLLKDIAVQMSSFVRLVEQISYEQSAIVMSGDSTFIRFGELLKLDVQEILVEFDCFILRLTNCNEYVRDDEIVRFKSAVNRFMGQLLKARTQVYYGEAVRTHKLDMVDLYGAHFFFFLEQIFLQVSQFKEPNEDEIPYRIQEFFEAALQIPVDMWKIISNLHTIVDEEGFLYPKLQNALKLAITMTIAAFLSYPLGVNTPTASIVALLHGSDSTFLWAAQHVEGVVVGAVTSYIVVIFTAGNYPAAVVAFTALMFVAQFTFTSKNWSSFAIALIINIALIFTFGGSDSALVVSLTNVVTAMGIHLLLTSFVIWPVNPISGLRRSIADNVATFRDGVCTVLTQLRASHLDERVSDDLTDAFHKRLKAAVARQKQLLPAAVAEPTLVGNDFPVALYNRVVLAEEKMYDVFYNTCLAFSILEGAADALASSSSSSPPRGEGDGVGATKKLHRIHNQVHWSSVRVIIPGCRQLASLINGFCDLILLLLEAGTSHVPISELVHLSEEITATAIRVGEVRNNKVNRIRAKKYRKAIRRRKAAAASGGTGSIMGTDYSDSSDEDRERSIWDDSFSSSDEPSSSEVEDEDGGNTGGTTNSGGGNTAQTTPMDPLNPANFDTMASASKSSHARHHHRDTSDETASRAGVGGILYSPSTAVPRRASAVFGGSVSSRPRTISRKKTRKPVDENLGVDLDTTSVHALATFLVGQSTVASLLKELLEALLDIGNVMEIAKNSE